MSLQHILKSNGESNNHELACKSIDVEQKQVHVQEYADFALNSNQSLPHSTSQLILYTILTNNITGMTYGGGIITANEDMILIIIQQLRYEYAAGGMRSVVALSSAIPYGENFSNPHVGSDTPVNSVCIISLSQGDSVQVRAYQDQTAVASLNLLSGFTRMQVYRI